MSKSEVEKIIYRFGATHNEIAASFKVTRDAVSRWLRDERLPYYVLEAYHKLDQDHNDRLVSLVSQIEALGFKVFLSKN
jgi:hypothetical protein